MVNFQVDGVSSAGPGQGAGPLSVPALARPQIDAFHRDGFVVMRGVFGPAAIARIAGWRRQLEAVPERPGRHWVYHEKNLLEPERDLICRIENISPFHAGFAELSRALKPSVSQLLGEEGVLFKEKVNFKMPGHK